MNRIVRTAALPAALLLLFTTHVAAQHREPPPDSTRASAPPCLRPELEQAAFLQGTWTVRSRKRTSLAENRWDESQARATWTPILGGCVYQEQWSGTLDGKPLAWIQLLAYDHRGEQWELVTIDGAHGNVVTTTGHGAAGALIFHTSQMRRGRLLIDRTTLAARDADTFEVTVETSADGGKTWTTFWTMTYTRR